MKFGRNRTTEKSGTKLRKVLRKDFCSLSDVYFLLLVQSLGVYGGISINTAVMDAFLPVSRQREGVLEALNVVPEPSSVHQCMGAASCHPTIGLSENKSRRSGPCIVTPDAPPARTLWE